MGKSPDGLRIGRGLASFVERSRIRHVPPGTALIRAGDRAEHAYYCSQGLFRLYYPLADGREYNVAFTLENDFATSYGA
jgi:CRP-like cAMP-binding protein